ncbi:MAG: hypothetical protein QM689_09790 [Oscillospiraceae bacterium]
MMKKHKNLITLVLIVLCAAGIGTGIYFLWKSSADAALDSVKSFYIGMGLIVAAAAGMTATLLLRFWLEIRWVLPVWGAMLLSLALFAKLMVAGWGGVQKADNLMLESLFQIVLLLAYLGTAAGLTALFRRLYRVKKISYSAPACWTGAVLIYLSPWILALTGVL